MVDHDTTKHLKHFGFWTKKKRRNVNEGVTVRKRLLRVEGVAGALSEGGHIGRLRSDSPENRPPYGRWPPAKEGH